MYAQQQRSLFNTNIIYNLLVWTRTVTLNSLIYLIFLVLSYNERHYSAASL